MQTHNAYILHTYILVHTYTYVYSLLVKPHSLIWKLNVYCYKMAFKIPNYSFLCFK